jgi:predicted PurR-regulated permease PerM
MSNQNQLDGAGRVTGALPHPDRGDLIPAPSRTGLGDFACRVLVVVLILALAYLFWRGVHVLLLAFAGVLLAVFLSALSEWLSRRAGIAYGWALAAVVTILIVLAGGFGWLLANRLAIQVAELAHQLPESLQRIRDYLDSYPWGHLLLEKAP